MPRHDADRNLLFGINALQNDFITRDALIAAMNAWALEKHRPIGEILVEHGDLDLADRLVLEAMIVRRIARHGDDPAASLAALTFVEDIAADLRRRVADHDVLASIAHVATESRLDPHATRAPEATDYLPVGIRYRKVRDHARGGLGIVYVALDEELRREVALKEIKPEYADSPASQSRFLLEAEITGGLEHPGIVPVYGLGSYDDGRPFYAMRFIKGDSLKDAIAAFHADATLRKDPGARALALQKLLRRFLDVCDAIAYAHSRGVLHRDLKPDNVMVGKYGETLVVDWGLAKAVGRSGSDGFGPLPESTVLYTSSSGSAETLPGSVVGTPAYMSPEQAAGRLDLLGPASDVYSLGATLYTLLTGGVPFTADDLADILRKVERGEFPRPREASPWLDPALEAITLKAMALRPVDRYPSPRALAEDVERWLADEPVNAHREPWARKARRWGRKHRTAVTSTVAVAVVAAILLGGYSWQRADRRRRADGSALAALGRADGLASGARASRKPGDWDKTIAEARIGREILDSGGGSPALRREVTARLAGFQAEKTRLDEAIEADRKDRQLVADLEEARLRRADLKDNQFDPNTMFEAYLAAFRAYGIEVGVLPVEDVAKRIRSSKVGDDLIAALDDWAWFEARKESKGRLLAIARASETDPARASIRDAVARRDAAALRRLCERAEDRRHLGPRLRNVFDDLVRLDPARSFPLLEAIRRENPSDFWFNFNLAWGYTRVKPQQLPEAARLYSVAVALRPNSASLRNNFGVVLKVKGDLDGAIVEHRKAIELDPKSARAHSHLGNALMAKGDLDGAIAEHREAIGLDPKSTWAHYYLGDVLKSKGDLDGAIAEHREAMDLDPKFAGAHTGLGEALKSKGDLDGAIAEYRKAVDLDPKNAHPRYYLGLALRSRGKVDEAVAELKEAARLDGENFGSAIGELGKTLLGLKRYDEAIETFREAARLKPDHAETHSNLGDALNAKGDHDGAIAEHHKAIELDPKSARAHYYLGKALKSKGDLDGAIVEYRKAIELDPKYTWAHYYLGIALNAKGDLDGALAEYRKAIDLDPKLPLAHFYLGEALWAKGDLDGAIVECRKAIELDPKNARPRYYLGLALRSRGKVDEAVAELKEAARLDGENFGSAIGELGKTLLGLKRYDEAIETFREAARLKPDLAETHSNLADALTARGDHDAAIASYRKAVQLKPDDALAHYLLGYALKAKGDRDGATEEFRTAIGIKPGDAAAHYFVGLAPRDKGMTDEAIDELREAIRLDGDRPGAAIWMLGDLLVDLDRPDEAIATYRRARESGGAKPADVAMAGEKIAAAERRKALLGRLGAVLKGEVRPKDAAEALAFADLLRARERHEAVARLYSEAFAADPKLPDDLGSSHRYNAACYAALAGTGAGKDDPSPDESARTRLREQALGWLRADLTALGKARDGGDAKARQALVKELAHWKEDGDLAGIRDEAALAKLPEKESEAFRMLWADVDRLLAKARAAAP